MHAADGLAAAEAVRLPIAFKTIPFNLTRNNDQLAPMTARRSSGLAGQKTQRD
jgi:hypothetical protein